MNKRQKQLLCMFLGGVLLIGTPGRTSAAEVDANEAEFSLEEYVVTANRMPTKISETAANVTVVSRKEIEQKNITSISEALTQAGVHVAIEGGSAADESSVVLNGDSRVVVLVDGRRINWEQQMDNAQTGYSLGMLPDLNSVEKIEVVRGAASSLYGSSGVGGVVNIITRKGTENRTTASTEFGSWGAQKYSLQTSGKSGDTSYMVAAERRKQGNYEYKEPSTGQVVTMPNSDFTRETASLRIDKEFDKDRTLTFYFDHLSEHSGYPVTKPGLRLPPGHPDPFSPNASRHTVQNNVSLAYHWKQGEDITNNLQIYRNHYKRFGYRCKYNTDNSTFDNNADGIEWNQTRRLNDHHTLLGGFDWRNTNVDFLEFDYTNNNIRNLGLFLEDRWTFDPRWTLTAGLRHDDSSAYEGSSTVRLSLNRKVNDTTNAYLSWGQVYRGPNAVDLFLPDSQYYRSNPNLKPEKGHTTTLGINTKLTGGTAIQASVFSTYLEDALSYNVFINGSSFIQQPYNVGKQKKHGLDLAVIHPLSQHLDLTAGYSYLQTKEDNKDGRGYQLDLTNSSPNAYRLGLLYHKDAWDISVMGRGASGRSLQNFTSDHYWVMDVAASYKIKPDLKVYAKAYNLTNRAYETTYIKYWGVGSQPMTSRQIVVGVEGSL